jgi:PTS hybrid protein
MVNLVIVSHSARLGEGVGELARQMLTGDGCKLAIAAGIDDPENPIGTDPIKVMEAIESVADTDHVLVMMDIGSALLSAETALDLLDPAIAAKVRLCAAPLVEGTLAATVSAASGSDIDKVIADAMNALEAKHVQLGLPSLAQNGPEATPMADDLSGESVSVVIKNHNGLHVRPASRLVAALSGFNAELVLEKGGKCVSPDSINQIALLQVRCNDTLRLLARGPDAEAALAAFQALAAENFGERRTPRPRSLPSRLARAGKAPATRCLPSGQSGKPVPTSPANSAPAAGDRPDAGRSQCADHAGGRALFCRYRGHFSGHHTLLDDPDLYEAACDIVRQEQCNAEWAWYQVLADLSQQYRQLDDAYLQARYIDVDDLLHRTLRHLQGGSEEPLAVHEPTIIIADDLFPSSVLQLDPRLVKGSVCGQEAKHLTARSSPVRPGSSACASREMPCSRYAMVKPLRWMSPENA